MMEIVPTRLEGRFVTIEPLKDKHRSELAAVGNDPRIWQNTPLGTSFDSYFDGLIKLRDGGTQIPHIVRLNATGQVIGASRFMDIVREHYRLEIGGTWYHPDHWGSAINPDAKLLLLTHAFEKAKANRVQLLTDVLNHRSQAAISKLGAHREGVIRNHMIVDEGRVRDSVSFSITVAEWPKVKSLLMTRLDNFAR